MYMYVYAGKCMHVWVRPFVCVFMHVRQTSHSPDIKPEFWTNIQVTLRQIISHNCTIVCQINICMCASDQRAHPVNSIFKYAAP